MTNRKFSRRSTQLEATKKCFCGGTSRLKNRRNFPHGRKSPGRRVISYLCPNCESRSILTKSRG